MPDAEHPRRRTAIPHRPLLALAVAAILGAAAVIGAPAFAQGPAEDAVPPTTTIQLNGADPVPTYESPVEVTFEATDDGGSGVEVTQYRVDGEAFTDYAGPFGVAGEDGEHTIEYRSRDVAGNVEETKSVTFEFETEDGGGTCMSRSDQFDGTALDPKWELVNPHPTSQPTVGGGHLTMPMVEGDLFGGNGTAQMLLQPVPPAQYNPVPGTNSWVATAKIAHANLDVDGEMAGIAVIGSLDPNYFVRTGLIYKDDINGLWDERVLTIDDEAVTLPGDDVPAPNSGLLEPEGDYIWVRLVADATTNEASTWVSTDGLEFTPFGANIAGSWDFDRSGPVRFGVFAKHDGTGDDEVQIDAFNFVLGTADPQIAGDDCGGPGDGDTTPPMTSVQLNGADPQAFYDCPVDWVDCAVDVTLSATDGEDEDATGVAHTEYRVNSDDPDAWERADNTAADDPFETTFTVSEPVTYEVEYRSVDQGGNVEATGEVRFQIFIVIVDPAPELSVSVKPERKVVGPRKTRARFRFHATYDPGPFGAHELELCARAPPRKVKVIGKSCRPASNLFRETTLSRVFKVRPKPAARGRRTRIRFIAKESYIRTKGTAVAKLRVRR